MYVVLALIILCTAAATVIAKRPRVASAAGCAVRTRLNAHRLADVHESMLRGALACRVPGLRRDYLPNRFVFGWHPDDMARWSQLSAHVASETGLILAERARAEGILLVRDVAVTIVEDPLAAPGRPTVLAVADRLDAVATQLLPR